MPQGDAFTQELHYEKVLRELQTPAGTEFFGVSRDYLEMLDRAHVFLIDRQRIEELSEDDQAAIDEELDDDIVRWPFPNLWLESTVETHEDPPRTFLHGAHVFRLDQPLELERGATVEAAYVEWLGLGADQYQARQGLFRSHGEVISSARQAVRTCPGCVRWAAGRPPMDWMLQPYDFLGFHGGFHEQDERCTTYRLAITQGIAYSLRAIAYVNLPSLSIVRATPSLTTREKKLQRQAETYRQFFPCKRVRHIVLDRNQIHQLQEAAGSGGEVTPHLRRAHWRRLPEGYRKARTWVRETFVGERRFSDSQKNVYEVLN